MAVWVYKNGESELIDPIHLSGSLEAGWSVEKEESVIEGMDDDELRLLAEEAGFDDFETADISVLKKVLEDK